jgi:hypothetical protein
MLVLPVEIGTRPVTLEGTLSKAGRDCMANNHFTAVWIFGNPWRDIITRHINHEICRVPWVLVRIPVDITIYLTKTTLTVGRGIVGASSIIVLKILVGKDGRPW